VVAYPRDWDGGEILDPGAAEGEEARMRIPSRGPLVAPILYSREHLAAGGLMECHSRSGVMRRKHSWDKDGGCLFCRAKRNGPAPSSQSDTPSSGS
jgi:hypothetical protein